MALFFKVLFNKSTALLGFRFESYISVLVIRSFILSYTPQVLKVTTPLFILAIKAIKILVYPLAYLSYSEMVGGSPIIL